MVWYGTCPLCSIMISLPGFHRFRQWRVVRYMSMTPEKASGDAGELEALPAEYRWRVHLLTENIWKSILLAVIIAGTCIGAWQWTGWPGMALLVLIVLVVSMAPYLFPVVYRVDGEGIEIWFLRVRTFRSWEEFRNFYPHSDGVHLSTFRKPSGLDAFRGSYIRFAPSNRELVIRFLENHIKRTNIKEREDRSGMSGKAELVTDSESDENNP